MFSQEEEDELPVDELPPWELEPPPINMKKVDLKDKDSILREGKKRKCFYVSTFVSSQ